MSERIARNVNALHAAEQRVAGLNQKIAVGLTKAVGTMETAYLFAVLAVVGLLAILGVLSPLIALLVVWASQTFIQLCMLPILAVGQQVLGRHAEIQSEEQYNFTLKSYQDVEQIMGHLDTQDTKIVEILERIDHQEHLILEQNTNILTVLQKLETLQRQETR